MSSPPQMIISLPVHNAECKLRPEGALTVVVAIQLFVPGSYFPPVLTSLLPSYPPQMIISRSVHTAVCKSLGLGAFVVVVAVQLSASGLYLPPVFVWEKLLSSPPQLIIS